MNIYIMSRGRAGKVTTLKWVPREWRDRTYLVVGHNERNEYRSAHPLSGIIEAPECVTNYSQKVQWILNGCSTFPSLKEVNESAEDKALIMDDDLVFSKKVGKSLISIKDPEDLWLMYTQIESHLSVYPLVGVHPRAMGQNAEQPYELNGRIICIQGINRRLIGHARVDQFPILADVVLNCTLLSRGQPNAIITTFFQDHGPCQAPGGCSVYRTPEMQRDAVDYLVRRFPGFVKAVERRPKVAKWMGDVRYEYTCQWKRLFAAGRAHLLHPGANPNPDKEGGGSAEAVE